MSFFDFIAYFWAENLIYVDHFIEFCNIWLLYRVLPVIWFTMSFFDFIAYFWAENLIYVDHFIEFCNIWHVCFFRKKI